MPLCQGNDLLFEHTVAVLSWLVATVEGTIVFRLSNRQCQTPKLLRSSCSSYVCNFNRNHFQVPIVEKLTAYPPF
jgi:hypothetical protein